MSGGGGGGGGPVQRCGCGSTMVSDLAVRRSHLTATRIYTPPPTPHYYNMSSRECAVNTAAGIECGNTVLRSVCAPPMSGERRGQGPASFKIQAPGGAAFAGVRGRIVAHGKGHMDHFTKVEGLATEYSAGACYKQCDTQLIEGNMGDSAEYRPPVRNSSSGEAVWSVKPCAAGNEAWCAANGFPSAIDGRYVDGISITYVAHSDSSKMNSTVMTV